MYSVCCIIPIHAFKKIFTRKTKGFFFFENIQVLKNPFSFRFFQILVFGYTALCYRFILWITFKL